MDKKQVLSRVEYPTRDLLPNCRDNPHYFTQKNVCPGRAFEIKQENIIFKVGAPSQELKSRSEFTLDLAAMNFGNIGSRVNHILRHNAIRTILTILGISVGVGAFICVVRDKAMQAAASSRSNCRIWGQPFIWIELEAAQGMGSVTARAAIAR